MNFYHLENLENIKNKDTGISATYMSKVFKQVGSKTNKLTVDDVMKYSIILLDEGQFVNTSDFYIDEIKDRRKKIPFALVVPHQKFSIENNGVVYDAKIINGNLFIAQPELLQKELDKEMNKFSSLTAEEGQALVWLETGETGTSSLSLCGAIYPNLQSLHSKFEGLTPNVPHDAADIQRCMKFFDMVPKAKEKIDNARYINAVWNQLIENWSALESGVKAKDYDAIYKIIQQCKSEEVKPDYKHKTGITLTVSGI